MANNNNNIYNIYVISMASHLNLFDREISKQIQAATTVYGRLMSSSMQSGET